MRKGSARLAQSRMYCLLDFLIVNHGGYWKRMAPSFPASASGGNAPRNDSHTKSMASLSRSFGYTRFLSLGGGMSRGSASTFVGCCVSSEKALMLNVKLSGVRSAQSSEVLFLGRK